MTVKVVLPRIQSEKIGDAAYAILREKIINQEFAPAQRLRLADLESQLGISRTPLKESLSRLAFEGLVDIRARRGTYVSDPGPEEIAESYEVRKALEKHAIELVIKHASDEEIAQLASYIHRLRALAARRDRHRAYAEYISVDHQLHRQVVGLTKIKRLLLAFDHENVHGQIARIRYGRVDPDLDLVEEEHEGLIAALEARDIETCQGVLAEHLARSKLSLLKEMKGKWKRDRRSFGSSD